MGSKFFSVYEANTSAFRQWVSGDIPNMVETLYARETPPEAQWRPVFEVMAQHQLVFMPEGEHEQGILYSRAAEYLLDMLDARHTSIEFYPQEYSEEWALIWDPCDSSWLRIPSSEYGIGGLVYRAPETCRRYARSFFSRANSGNADPQYLSEASARELANALQHAADSNQGALIMYQA